MNILIASAVLIMALLFFFVPLVASCSRKAIPWNAISLRPELPDTDWMELYLGEVAEGLQKEIVVFLDLLCNPVSLKWTKLRPTDEIGPSSYRNWLFEVESIWEGISDEAKERCPNISGFADELILQTGAIKLASLILLAREMGARAL
jgi:hypothetical protein